jgi:hypothetical protein
VTWATDIISRHICCKSVIEGRPKGTGFLNSPLIRVQSVMTVMCKGLHVLLETVVSLRIQRKKIGSCSNIYARCIGEHMSNSCIIGRMYELRRTCRNYGAKIKQKSQLFVSRRFICHLIFLTFNENFNLK